MTKHSAIVFAVSFGFTAVAAHAESPASAFARGSGQQSWQNPGFADVLAECTTPAPPFRIGGDAPADLGPPPEPPALPTSTEIPGIIAGGETWEVVWSWEGNNADGLIPNPDGTVTFANNDASNIMRLDPETELAEVLYSGANTAGAVSRSKNGDLFMVSRGLGGGVWQLEPVRRVFADKVNGEPVECVGGVLNDLAAAANGGVYVTISGAGVFYATPDGNMTEYGENIEGANGIVLSPDETTLYVTNGPVLVAFDVQPDGSLTNQRDFGMLQGGQGGDGSTVDTEGRIYVATGQSADVFSPDGEFLGSIPGPQGMHGVSFGGRDKEYLYGIVFYGAWGTANARNQVIRIPLQSRGYGGRAK